VAAPRQEAVGNSVTADIVLASDFTLLHELDDPSHTTAELETAPSHAVGVEALIALQSWVSETVGSLAINEAGTECSLEAEIVGAFKAVEEAVLPFLLAFWLLGVAWL